MPMTRCPVVRPQAGSCGARGFTTDYHDWSAPDGRCKFCSVSRRDANVATATRPSWRDWEARESEQELQTLLADMREANPAFVPDPARWACVMQLLPRAPE